MATERSKINTGRPHDPGHAGREPDAPQKPETPDAPSEGGIRKLSGDKQDPENLDNDYSVKEENAISEDELREKNI